MYQIYIPFIRSYNNNHIDDGNADNAYKTDHMSADVLEHVCV